MKDLPDTSSDRVVSINEEGPHRTKDSLQTANTAYRIFFFLGLGNLFPWNAFISVPAYFGNRFCGTYIENTFENFFSLAYNLFQTFGLIITVAYAHNWSLQTKVIYPLILYTIIFAATSALTLVFIDANLFFAITLIGVSLSGLCSSLNSAGLFSMAANFPFEYTGALMNGQGLAGFTISLSSLSTSWAGQRIDVCNNDDYSEDEDCKNLMNYSALAYFTIATIVLFLNIFSFMALRNLSISKYYLNRGNNQEQAAAYNALLPDDIDFTNDMNINSTPTSLQFSKVSQDIHETDGRVISVLKMMWKPAIAVFLAFLVTIGIYPSVFVLVESQYKCEEGSSRIYNDLFLPFLFLIYNVFDFAGRVSAEKFKPRLNENNIVPFALLRIFFIPLVLTCNIPDSQFPTKLPYDAVFFVAVIFFAFSNGYLASAAMMLGPTLVSPKDQSTAGTIMIFALTIGLFAGGALSFLCVYISQGSHSFDR